MGGGGGRPAHTNARENRWESFEHTMAIATSAAAPQRCDHPCTSQGGVVQVILLVLSTRGVGGGCTAGGRPGGGVG